MESADRWLVAIALVGALIGGAGLAYGLSQDVCAPIEGGVPLSSTDDTTVIVDGDSCMDLRDFTTLTSQVDLVTDEGNATVFASGQANATIDVANITGTWTNVTAIDADPNPISIDPEDKQEVTVGNNIDHVAWRDNTQLDDGVVDFTYGGPSGNSRVTLRNVTPDTDIQAVDANTNTILDKATSTGGGAVTFDALDNSHHAVLLQESNGVPVLSNPTPSGPQTTTVSTFNVDVNDTEFSQGDSVTAELFVESVSQGTDSLNSNGTASVNHNIDLGESIEYSWVATDSFGAQDTINSTLTTPVNVTFREEHNASKLVTGVNTTITLFSDDAMTILTRSDDNDDGNISLEGIPDKEFVAVVESEDHYTRRVYIESIFSQQNIFLLNKTEVPGPEAINTTFVFEDRTGEFPPENTTLRIQRGLDINNDNESEWLTVAGDFWGAASEFPFTGEENARYRLVVENRQGERRVLGTHIPVADGTKTIINGEIRWEAGQEQGIFFDAVLNQEDDEIEAFYTDPANTTSEVRIQVWERGNQSNEIYDQNFTNGPYGTIGFDPLVALDDNQTQQSWVVQYTYVHDGQTDQGQLTVGAPQVGLPVDPWLLAAFAVLGVTFVGTLYGPRTATIGAWMMVVTVIGLTAFGLAQFPIASVVAGVVVAAGGTFYREAVP